MEADLDYRKALAEYFSKQENVICAYLFGSCAAGKESAYSDVDIAVLYNRAIPPVEYSNKQITLSIDLSRLLDRNVDVVILNRASPYLKFQIIREGIRVYENPKRRGRAFEAHSIVEYFDLLPVKNMLESAIIKRLRGA